jgi:tetratricopeptide (TPR) repeat protein
MDKRELESTMERRYEHRYQIPLIVAFLLLVGEMLIGERASRPPLGAKAGGRDVSIALMLAAALVLTGASWIAPHAKAREASQLYEKGDFDAATQKYNEALTDDPDSYLLQYNRGASLYRQEKFEDAAARSAIARPPPIPQRRPTTPGTRSTSSARRRRSRIPRKPSASTPRRWRHTGARWRQSDDVDAEVQPRSWSRRARGAEEEARRAKSRNETTATRPAAVR